MTTNRTDRNEWVNLIWRNYINVWYLIIFLLLLFLSFYLQSEDDAHWREKQREEGPGIEPGDGGRLDGNAGVFEIVGHKSWYKLYSGGSFRADYF